MSGGAFNYDQYKIQQIADEIKHIVETNGRDEEDQWGDRMYSNYPPEVIARFQEAIHTLEVAFVYAHRIDWLLSGDDGEENFGARLDKDLSEAGK